MLFCMYGMSQVSLRGNTFYAFFNGTNHYNFSPAAGVSIEFDKKKFLYGISFMKFSPRKDIFYFYDEFNHEVSTIKFKDYLVIPAYVGRYWTIQLVNGLDANIGFQFGYTIVNYEYETETTNASYQGGKVGFAPRFNISYEITDLISVYANYKYHGMFEIKGSSSSGNSSGAIGNSASHEAGEYHHFNTTGIGIQFNFY